MKMNLFDTLMNLVTNMGTSIDKTTQSTYNYFPLTDDQLNAAYRSSWMARKVVDIPAFDSCREWRDWQASDPEIELLENEERRLNYQGKLQEAMIQARLYGGSAIILGIRGDQDSTKPLDVNKLGRDSLEFMHVCARKDITTGQLIRDPLSPFYKEPDKYTVQSASKGTVDIHPSRVVRLFGASLPDVNLANAGQGWGDSILQVVDDAIKQAYTVLASSATLVSEAKIDVIQIPNLMQQIATQDYENKLLRRFNLANMAKGVVNTLILDKDEEWNRMTANFGGLDAMLQLFLLVVSAASDIPATRMLGQSPAGLSATGESDVRNYYDRIASEQNTVLRPALARLDEVLIRSALNKRPPEVHYIWAPLWQMSETEKATTGLAKAQAHQIDVQLGLISPDALRAGRENQLVEDGVYPGFEAALDEFANLPLDEGNAEVVTQFDALKARRRKSIKDATPRTMYVRRDVLNYKDIVNWAKDQGIDLIVPGDTMHVTLAFSREHVDWMKMGTDTWASYDGKADMVVPEGGPRVVERLGPNGAIVLMFSSCVLTWRWQEMVNRGAKWEWQEFQPHVTIAYKGDPNFDLSKVEPYRGKIELGPEIFEEIDEDYVAKLKQGDLAA